MFRTSYFHLQKDYIVHAALYVMFSVLKFQHGKHNMHVQHSLPEGEHKMFETCRRQEELN